MRYERVKVSGNRYFGTITSPIQTAIEYVGNFVWKDDLQGNESDWSDVYLRTLVIVKRPKAAAALRAQK